MINDVLALILGGGQGTRLFPLTQHRSKPAVPIGGKYRLIDIPDQQLPARRHPADLRADAVQLGVAQPAHRADLPAWTCSRGGFVEILAAEQTPDNPNWFQGTADAVRQAARHFARYDADYYLILAGDHLYRMDYARAGRRARRSRRRHHDRRAAGRRRRTRRRWASSGSTASGQIVGFEEKPTPERLARDRPEHPGRRDRRRHITPTKPFVASMGIYVFSRDVLLEMLERDRAVDFGREIIPRALDDYRVHAVPLPRLLGRRRHGRVVLRRQHHAHAARRAVQVLRSRAGRSTRTRASCPASRLRDCALDADASSPRAAISTRATIDESVVGIRTHDPARRARSRARCCSAPTSTRPTRASATIADSASAATSCSTASSSTRTRASATASRLVNERGVEDADGDGYYIRSGIIIVPKDGVVKPGTVV